MLPLPKPSKSSSCLNSPFSFTPPLCTHLYSQPSGIFCFLNVSHIYFYFLFSQLCHMKVIRPHQSLLVSEFQVPFSFFFFPLHYSFLYKFYTSSLSILDFQNHYFWCLSICILKDLPSDCYTTIDCLIFLFQKPFIALRNLLQLLICFL